MDTLTYAQPTDRPDGGAPNLETQACNGIQVAEVEELGLEAGDVVGGLDGRDVSGMQRGEFVLRWARCKVGGENEEDRQG